MRIRFHESVISQTSCSGKVLDVWSSPTVANVILDESPPMLSSRLFPL